MLALENIYLLDDNDTIILPCSYLNGYFLNVERHESMPSTNGEERGLYSNQGARWHRLLIVKLDCTTNVD
jgi:hypothetical protein